MSTVEITITEQHGARELSRSDNGETITVSRSFNIFGAETEQDATEAIKNFLEDEINVESKTLKLDSISINEFTDDHWNATATWTVQRSNIRFTGTDGRFYEFNISSTTANIKQSIETVGKYPAGTGGVAPNYLGAIGVSKDGIAGVDIVIPIFNFSETVERSTTYVDTARLREWARLTGKINANPFKGHERGEVLFMGCSGSRRAGEYYKIMFHFAVQENARNITVGEINIPEKLGWDYLWILYRDTVDEIQEFVIKEPQAAYVEKVYKWGNFGILGL